MLTWKDINAEFGTNAEHILLLVDLLLTIPGHSAECERGFSLLKTIKTDWRNKLTDEAVTDLIRITLESADIKSFNPDPAIHAWNNSSIAGCCPNQKRWKKKRPKVAVAVSDSDEHESSSSDTNHSDNEISEISDQEIQDNDSIVDEVHELFNSTDSDESEFHGFEI